MKMDKILLILVVLSLLLAGVQAIQLGSVKKGLDSGSVSIASSAKSTSGGSSPAHKPAMDIKIDIPDQVGGCF